jgi:V/A-type H+-transporting ATPase subunit D
MPNIDIPPTRSNLLRLKQELLFAREGYEILDRKREVLTSELLRIAHDTEKLQAQVWASLAAAYHSLEKARLTMGQERVEWAALAASKTFDIRLTFRGVMGISLPVVKTGGGESGMPFSLGDTKVSVDEAYSAFRDLSNKIPELSELTTSVWWLASELRKTLRRVNALQHIFIPGYEQTIAFIESALEEHEREETFRLKRLKLRATKKTASRPAAGQAAHRETAHDGVSG